MKGVIYRKWTKNFQCLRCAALKRLRKEQSHLSTYFGKSQPSILIQTQPSILIECRSVISIRTMPLIPVEYRHERTYRKILARTDYTTALRKLTDNAQCFLDRITTAALNNANCCTSRWDCSVLIKMDTNIARQFIYQGKKNGKAKKNIWRQF